MDFDVKLEGFEEIERNLKQFAPRIEKNILTRAMRAGGREIVKEAKSRVPVETGNLKKSLGQKVRRVPGLVVIEVGARSGKTQKYDGWYAHLVEFGTKYIPARPFLRPSIKASQNKILNAVRKVLSDGIKKEAAK